MQMFSFATTVNEDGTKIVSVAGRIADHPQSDEQSEWIDFQFAIDMPTVRNGALQRQAALIKARDIIQQLANDYEKIGRER